MQTSPAERERERDIYVVKASSADRERERERFILWVLSSTFKVLNTLAAYSFQPPGVVPTYDE